MGHSVLSWPMCGSQQCSLHARELLTQKVASLLLTVPSVYNKERKPLHLIPP